MKIIPVRGGAAQAGVFSPQKSIGGLTRGDTFTAIVAGVLDGEVLLNLPGGNQIRAKAKNPGAFTTGEKLSFTVEGNEGGQIFVKMAKDNEEGILRIAAKALSDAGLPTDEKNIEAAKAVIERGLPPDKEMLNSASFGMTLKGMTPEKLLFLIEENIEISEESLKQLNGLITEKNGMALEIDKLIEKLARLPESQRELAVRALQNGLSSGIPEDQEAPAEKLFKDVLFSGLPEGKKRHTAPQNDLSHTELKTRLKKALFLDVLNDKEPPAYYKRLHKAVSALLKEAAGNSGLNELVEDAEKIKSSLEFQNKISENKYFMQIPFVLEGRTGQGDLYIFKDSSKHGNLKKRATALLCLDLTIGHIEAFIVKEEKSVTCSIGFSEPKYIKLFKDNEFELHKLLAQKGFKLNSVVFEPLSDTFSVLKEREEKKPPGTKKFTFDMKA